VVDSFNQDCLGNAVERGQEAIVTHAKLVLVRRNETREIAHRIHGG